MSKGLIAVRVYKKHWEAERLIWIMRHWCPNDDIVIFCNCMPSALWASLPANVCHEFVSVDKQESSPYFDKGAPCQVGSIMLEIAVAKYAKDKRYDFILSLNADEWLVTDNFKEYLQLIKDKERQLVIPWVLHPNGKENYYYVSLFAYDGNYDLFSDEAYVFSKYRKTIEYTFGDIIAEKKKEFESQGRKFEVVQTLRTFKYGYDANWGTFQHCTRTNPENRKYYEPYFDENKKVPVFDFNKDISIPGGWKCR